MGALQHPSLDTKLLPFLYFHIFNLDTSFLSFVEKENLVSLYIN